MEDTFESKVQMVLRDNILSFWQDRAIDSERQLPFGKVDAIGVPVADEPIGAILTARILWAFSTAYGALKKDSYLKTAEMIHRRMTECFFDRTDGGLWYAVNREEAVLDSRKQSDCQAYAIYALCAYFSVSGDKAALDRAADIFEYIEKNALSDKGDGYLDLSISHRKGRRTEEVESSDASLTVRSLNTHLHLLEAYTSLYCCTKDARIQGRLASLFDMLADHFYGDGLFYSNLTVDLHPKDNTTLYGMNLETAWLLTQASIHLNDEAYAYKADAILMACASKTLAVAVDEDGAVYYSGNGCHPKDYNKQWWVQAEAAVAFLIAYEKSLKPHYFDAFIMLWDFILKYLVDSKIGEWRIGTTKENKVMEDDHRSGFWKCPYHNTRACLETLKRKELIRDGLKLYAQTEALDADSEQSFQPSS